MSRLRPQALLAGSAVYLVAIIATAVAALIRDAVGDLGGRGPLGPFFLAVLLSGWLGGLWPGLLATVLSTLVTSLFFVERTGLLVSDIGDGLAISLFFVFGVLTSWICEVSRRRRRSLEAKEQDLRAGRQMLEESEERYRLLTEAQPGMVWTLRPDHTVDYVNSAWEAYTGRQLDQIDAAGWRDLVHEDDRAAMIAAISAPLERGEPHTVRVRFRRYDGMYRWVLSRVVPVRDASGTIAKWIGTTTDVHDLWLAREGLRESTARLQESEVKRQESEERRLLNERALQSQKLEAVGRLAGGVAHDFNNLLTIINGYTDLMLTRFDAGDPTRHDLEAVRVAGQRAASLTNQLLAVGRRQLRQPVVLDVGAIVEESARALRPLLGPDVEIAVTGDQRPARVKADPRQLSQVLLNLAINAREAMPAGGRLTFSTSIVEFRNAVGRHPDLSPGRYVRLTVDDTGCGMTAEIKARSFEAFFTTKPFGKGSGLGLAAVDGIIQQSGGHIDVNSEPGRGTTFVIYFPYDADGQ